MKRRRFNPRLKLSKRGRLTIEYWSPTWSNSVYEKWAQGFVTRNYWRVQHETGSREDAVQECAFLFAKCINYYVVGPRAWTNGRRPVTEPQHFMSLFKTAVEKRFNGLAVRDGLLREMYTPEFVEIEGQADKLSPEGYPRGEKSRHRTLSQNFVAHPTSLMEVALREASSEVVDVLTLLAEAPQEILDVLLSGHEYPDTPPRSLLNRRLCRLLRVPDSTDLLGKINELLGVAPPHENGS